MLREFAANIDLERLVNHRGSAFGSTFTPQPTPIGFENRLAIEMLLKSSAPRLLIEDESRTIGRLALPDALHAAMQAAPLVVIDVSRNERVERIYREYLEEPLQIGVAPPELHRRFVDAVDRIRRRLGGLRHAEVRGAIDTAFATAETQPHLHLQWIRLLLDWYYDPMYDHQLTTKRARIIATGDPEAIRAFIREELSRDQPTLMPAP